jgi:hypothetical protein
MSRAIAAESQPGGSRRTASIVMSVWLTVILRDPINKTPSPAGGGIRPRVWTLSP